MNQTATGGSGDSLDRIAAWARRNRRRLTVVGVVVALGAASTWFVIEYQRRKEGAATIALEQSRAAIQSGNLPLAASDLARLAASYGGTRAADEAVILLAQVRLLQNQATQAAQELRQALDGGVAPQFEAAAYSLLGAALEDLGNMAEAGSAYERAAEAAWYDPLKAQYLNDAGRAFGAAGDVARAIAAYERVVTEYGESSGALEARVRLAELRAAESQGGRS